MNEFHLTARRTSGAAFEHTLKIGDTLYILGANGSGKSSLVQMFYATHRPHARRIAAHRQTWFSSNSLALSPEQKRATETNIGNSDSTPQARWRDDFGGQRANIAIFDLIDAENVRARKIAEAVDRKDMAAALRNSSIEAPIRKINELLRLSSIPIEILVQRNEQIFARKLGGLPYSVAELSDGERNALLIAAEVLTADPNSLIIIDEPERHLHRSISAPLLTQLFGSRPDCAFIISTHDVSLANDDARNRILLVRGCTYVASSVSAWDIDLVPANIGLDDSLRGAILGQRRQVLFVEGDEQSLDKTLYSLVFQTVSVVAKRGCRDVEHAVAAIRDSHDLHWIKAVGIIDGDGRSLEEIEALKTKGVYAVPFYSVEAIYYHETIQRKVVERQAEVTGASIPESILQARDAAIEAIEQHFERMAARVAERAIRLKFFEAFPSFTDIQAGKLVNLSIDAASILGSEKAILRVALDKKSIEDIIKRYPIRETGALARIADKLGFKNREQYESAVRKLLLDDPQAVSFVKAFFGDLENELTGGC